MRTSNCPRSNRKKSFRLFWRGWWKDFLEPDESPKEEKDSKEADESPEAKAKNEPELFAYGMMAHCFNCLMYHSNTININKKSAGMYRAAIMIYMMLMKLLWIYGPFHDSS